MFCGLYEPNGWFEPSRALLRQSDDLVFQATLLADELVLGLAVFLDGHCGVEVGRHQATEFRIRLLDLATDSSNALLGSVLVGRLLSLQFSNEPVGGFGWQRDKSNEPGDLFGDDLLADKALRAVFLDPLGAVKVVVTLLGFGGDEATAFTAAEYAAIEIRFEFRRSRLAPAVHDSLHRIEHVLCNERFMLAGILLSLLSDDATIDVVLEQAVILRTPQGLTRTIGQAKVIDRPAEPVKRVAAGGMQFKGLADERGTFRVGHDHAGSLVVEVASSSATRQDFIHDAPHLVMRLVNGKWLFNENTAQLFVAGFTATFKILDMDCCASHAKVYIRATNISGTASVLRPPGGGPVVPNIPNGWPFGITSQTWDYTETISWEHSDIVRAPG